MKKIRSNIALTGFMGTGKSTVGKALAGRMGWVFVDTDSVIEAQTGDSIAAIFARYGEKVFRQIEAEVCQRIALQDGQVLALGGGALLDEQTRCVVEANSLVICLTASLDEIMRRTAGDSARPLLGDWQAASRLLTTRADHYASQPLQVDTTRQTPDSVVEEIIALWRRNS